MAPKGAGGARRSLSKAAAKAKAKADAFAAAVGGTGGGAAEGAETESRRCTANSEVFLGGLGAWGTKANTPHFFRK